MSEFGAGGRLLSSAATGGRPHGQAILAPTPTGSDRRPGVCVKRPEGSLAGGGKSERGGEIELAPLGPRDLDRGGIAVQEVERPCPDHFLVFVRPRAHHLPGSLGRPEDSRRLREVA